MADDWHTPSAINDKCGEDATYNSGNMIDNDTGTRWTHYVSEAHWIIFDMGETYTVKKVQIYHTQYVSLGAPSAIYVSDDTGDFGDSVGSSAADYWNDATGWDEIDTTDKNGRYIKVVASGTAEGPNWYEFDIYGDTAGAAAVGFMTLNTGYWGI